ncbi:MAG: DNA ligase-associated DEXH box helicase, partial [Candidatus Omnitrophica bacterium]|nr:DNA ligase-associated DEXH box helicase [Candidatus Omnitrophota bacterium]
MPDLIRWTDHGLFCEPGNFFIDPWRPVDRAVITHGHSDHSRPGSTHYLCSNQSLSLLRARLPDEAAIESVPYGIEVNHNGIKISFHPAGHILGSSQIRVEKDGEVWVV